MNSTGIAGAGGAGKHIAEWIVDDDTSLNLWAYDVRRFVRLHNNKKFLRDRMPEAFGTHCLQYLSSIIYLFIILVTHFKYFLYQNKKTI